MNLKAILTKTLRATKLLHAFDKLRFYLQKNRKKNTDFKKQNAEIKLPPDYLIYESFRLDYQKYYFGGKSNASEIIDLIKRYKTLDNLKILDWGCGPARIIRHFPELLDNSNSFYASDYNINSIKWCTENLNDITFKTNSLTPPLDFENGFFDVIYGISIFTHLSEKSHYEWIDELHRVLKKDGILILSLQGDYSKSKLTEKELEVYNKGNLVIRGNVKEGHRIYSTFHPEEFLKRLFNKFTILEHIKEDLGENMDYIPQDTWIIKK